MFEESPYEGGYDLKINCTKSGQDIDSIDFKQSNSNFKHALVFFQGLESIEGLIELDEAADMSVKEIN